MSLAASDGWELVADVLDSIVEGLPDGNFRDTDRITQMMEQILNPPEGGVVSKETADLLAMLNPKGAGIYEVL